MPPPPTTIVATNLSNYIRLDRCGRFLRFVIEPAEAKVLGKRLGVGEDALSPILADYGQDFEARVLATLPETPRDLKNQPAEATLAALRAVAPGARVFLTQARLAGAINGWPCLGDADIIHVSRQADGAFDLAVLDVKTSIRDHVEYRLQVAVYLRLLRGMLAGAGLALGAISGAILKQGAEGALPAWDDPAARFAVAPYDLVLDHLFDPLEGDLAQVAGRDLADIPYALNAKCDGCSFNRLCMRESADRQDIALVPGIQATDIPALKAAGVRTLRELVDLKALPDPPTKHAPLPPAPGQSAPLAALSQQPALAARLDPLVLRARAILNRFDPAVRYLAYPLDEPPSLLPPDGANPQLVKIFLDAQHDYLRDRVYLAGALLTGPGGEYAVAHICDGPPVDRDEEYVLHSLLRDVVAALPQVAGDATSCPLHIYLFDPFEQRIWLDALERQQAILASVPAFYELLTSNAGVEEVMFAFLADEIRARRILPMTCQNLYSVATNLKFAWRDAHYDYRADFRERIFDNAAKRADGVWVEQRAAFTSLIPLEYAYGAWGVLPARSRDPGKLAYYRRCTRDALKAFQVHRLRAMQHIEAALNPAHGQRFVKSPLPIAQVNTAPELPDLARALDEFLGMEHHAALQGKLAIYQLPLARRVQTGRCLPLRCQSVTTHGKRLSVTGALDYAAVDLDAATARAGCRLKEGDWLLLNDLDHQQPWAIMQGRIAVVRRMEADAITLDLLDITSFGSDFKYRHDTKLVPEAGKLYALNEMADDLNADKHRQAVHHARGNALFAALAGDTAPAPIPPEPHGATFVAEVQRLQDASPLTAMQAEVVGATIAAPLLLVQGPPGTGKTATLGWAILARLFAHQLRPVRVLVCAKTHKATNLVLASVAERLTKLKDTRAGKSLGVVHVFKATADEGEDLPDHVHALDPRHGGRVRGIFADEGAATVIGATPGGAFSLMKTVYGKDLPWSAGPFDLLVIDEASQMSIPEALLAAAFLAPGGRIMIVGDHRQMPPILAHPWARERRHSQTLHHPARSIFEALLDQGQPIVQLDESFRLHQTQARFLAAHIYARDALPFQSRRKDTLPALPASVADPFVVAALRPDYPVIVVEHGEAASQQYNPTEVEVIAPIVRACLDALHLDGAHGLGIVVPHNAQKAALRQRFPALDAAGAIDTVERFQGGERDVIIVAATASDPSYILAEAAFLLNLNRLNVAFSRPRLKLIVVAARTLFRFLCRDLDRFEEALIWKHLRYEYAATPLWAGSRAGVRVEVRGHPAGHAIQPAPPDVAIPAPFVAPQPVGLTERSHEPL